MLDNASHLAVGDVTQVNARAYNRSGSSNVNVSGEFLAEQVAWRGTDDLRDLHRWGKILEQRRDLRWSLP